ncbi:MAG: hypothetical protein IPH52_20775 [Leptospiraceae bacterium]|nr:hypothetical protein [Leptospiraceae bacterium]
MEKTVNAKTFEELLEAGVILKSVPPPIRGIWHGELGINSIYKSNQIEILDMCSYPIKSFLQIQSPFDRKYTEHNDLAGIREYDRSEYRKDSINVYLYFFNEKSRKQRSGSADYRFYKNKNMLTQERNSPDEKSLIGKWNIKERSAPNNFI